MILLFKFLPSLALTSLNFFLFNLSIPLLISIVTFQTNSETNLHHVNLFCKCHPCFYEIYLIAFPDSQSSRPSSFSFITVTIEGPKSNLILIPAANKLVPQRELFQSNLAAAVAAAAAGLLKLFVRLI